MDQQNLSLLNFIVEQFKLWKTKLLIYPSTITRIVKKSLSREKIMSPQLTLKTKIFVLFQDEKFKHFLGYFLELVMIALWVLWIDRAYLNFNPKMWIDGREFGSEIQANSMWVNFLKCGACALWNGSVKGGYPAFADTYGGMLHPLVVASTILFGVINGAKVTFVISVWVAGFAQWWLGLELRLKRIPRLWSAMMVIVAGHISAKMESGLIIIVLSTAMCSLVFAGILRVYRRKDYHASIILGFVGFLALVSGQGYLQVGLLGALPLILIFVVGENGKINSVWKKYVLAGTLAILMASYFLIPLVHFSPNITKYQDVTFNTAQPLKYIPLNLLIDDPNYFSSNLLGKSFGATMYSIFIGWIPLLLAILGLALGKPKDRKWLWFSAIFIFFELLFSSAVLLKWVLPFIPEVAGIRYPGYISGLIVPVVLGLSAYGLQQILDIQWPEISLKFMNESSFRNWHFSTKWLLLIFLIISLKSGINLSKMWIRLVKQDPNVPIILDKLKTESLQWIEPPFGEHFFVEPAIAAGLKLSPGILPWNWKNREAPIPYLEATRGKGWSDANLIYQDIAGVDIYLRENQVYAAVYHGDSFEECNAKGVGGNLDVVCETDIPGKLILKENNYSGWKAYLDDQLVTLYPAQWLEVNAPSGRHTYKFKFLPWDVLIGLGLSILGLGLSIFYWRKK